MSGHYSLSLSCVQEWMEALDINDAWAMVCVDSHEGMSCERKNKANTVGIAPRGGQQQEKGDLSLVNI